ncbi:DNA mismatch repair protein [Tieghemiomyces parasiticus]|uniref:DNA mismatch repair protein n=1 Tax=Tieghemiomyces parasiticus TaxID=78921 RepID=A0A9W8AEX6_9FUNG|nr:DNA mismatch repair protein [Tieghemiomyces parasiticus]
MPDPPPSVAKPKPIRRLDETVVNRIAAGEIILRPANALKELLENSLDAGTKTIQILVKDGGLKLLQIQDSGHGIRKDDLAIVCERFTTSKLRTFEDLSSIQTFGFRGEALASISHIAHITITSRTADSNCAFRACYADGKLIPAKPGANPDPKPCAGNVGTQITVEDLFFNVPFRRQALRNPNDEYNRILDVVSKYAVHNSGVGFSCRKQGSATADLHTASNAAPVDIISQLYGSTIKGQLLKLICQDQNLGFSAKGYVTHANFSLKRFTFILFINNSLALKKAVEGVYTTMLPKGSHPFAYLALTINPENVDVNVHPTKREVHFLHEEDITAAVVEALQATLANCNESRTYQVQSLLAAPVKDEPINVYLGPTPPTRPPVARATPAKPYEHKMVRTDTRSRTLESLLFTASPRPKPALGTGRDPKSQAANPPGPVSPQSGVSPPLLPTTPLPAAELPRPALAPTTSIQTESRTAHQDTGPRQAAGAPMNHHQGPNPRSPLTQTTMTTATSLEAVMEPTVPPPLAAASAVPSHSDPASTPTRPLRPKVEVRLTSVLELREELQAGQHTELTTILRNHTFVGLVDYERALIQHNTRLFMINYVRALEELFYQRTLWQFCNFGSIVLDPPVALRDLLAVALRDNLLPPTTDGGEEVVGAEIEPDPAHVAAQADALAGLLEDQRDMLDEYFFLTITEAGQLTSLPLLIPGYTPNLLKLPTFLLRLVTTVNWDEEKACFRNFSRELARFYAPAPPLVELGDETVTINNGDPLDAEWDTEAVQGYRESIQHHLFPAFKAGFVAPVGLADAHCAIQLADLPDLYRIFERC